MPNKLCMAGKKAVVILLANLLAAFCIGDWAGCAYASAEQSAADPGAQEGRGDDAEHRTPLAGEAKQVSFMGQTVIIPAQDRSRLTSLTLGGSILQPEQGSTRGVPIAALYFRRIWEEARTRGVINIFVNELEYDKSFGRLELVGHFENCTIPDDHTELLDNREIKQTSLVWGSFLGSLGPGLRFPVSPFQVDNDFRLQLLARAGYFYAERTHDTGSGVVEPPGAMLYGVKLRGRYDGMRRNLLELPHRGLAVGFDLDYLKRNNWRDLSAKQTGANHRDYYQVSGHLLAAGGIPGLSERNRLLVNLYGGGTGENKADRFNAFLINGGPFASETDDLAKPHYTGIAHEYLRASAYAIASLAYRREIAFFLYATIAGAYVWADRTTVEGGDQVVFKEKSEGAVTVSLDSAFFWNSSLYLAYSRESGLIRNGKPGSGVTLLWNKLF